MRATRATIAIGIAALLIVVAATTAAAAWWTTRDAEQADRGQCDGATYDLSVERDDGRLEVSFEVQSQSPGEEWSVVLTEDGQVLREARLLTDDEGELDVDAVVDLTDAAVFEATATSGDRECSATARW